MAFADDFTFSRPGSAQYVDAAGITRTAAPDVPRFDHSGRGRPIGLLVEPGAALGQADRTRVIAGDWAALEKSTVLHLWNPGSGVVAQAHYALDPVAMINGCLTGAGHHRQIAVIEGFLKNYGGWVWALGQRWDLPRLVGTTSGVAIGAAGRPVIGS